MQLGDAVRDTEPRADILGATHDEPLPSASAAVAQEERRGVVGPCRQVPLDLSQACLVITAARSTSPLPQTTTRSRFQSARSSCSASEIRQPVLHHS
jgi:hypothetical protein